MRHVVLVQDLLRHAEHRVDALNPVGLLPQQAEARHSEQSVEGVRHISWPVRESPSFVILKIINKPYFCFDTDWSFTQVYCEKLKFLYNSRSFSMSEHPYQASR